MYTTPIDDPVRDLNNLLQRYKAGNGGNLTQNLSWVVTQTGLDHQRTLYATANFNGEGIGSGWGTSLGNAKRAAAIEALQTLRDRGYR